MFKVNNKDTSDNKDTSVFIVNFENISHLVLVVLLLTLSMSLSAVNKRKLFAILLVS